MKELQDKKKELCIYCRGAYAIRTYLRLRELGVHVSCFGDADPNKAGYVLDGVFQRGCKIRISRGEEQIFEGNLASLKRFKDDVKEVKAGYECGLVFEGFNDIQELDVVEAYTMVEVPR